MAQKTVIEAIREGMDEEMARDPSVFLIGEDVGQRGGVFLASDGLYKKYGEYRVIDSPLAESCVVGVAIGAAVNGMRPIAEIQFADFIAPAMNQIIEEAARFCYRTAGDFNLPMVIRAPWGGGVHGALYHSQSIEATFGHIPGLKVVAPGTPADAKGLLKAAVRDPDPVLFLEHKRTYRPCPSTMCWRRRSCRTSTGSSPRRRSWPPTRASQPADGVRQNAAARRVHHRGHHLEMAEAARGPGQEIRGPGRSHHRQGER